MWRGTPRQLFSNCHLHLLGVVKMEKKSNALFEGNIPRCRYKGVRIMISVCMVWFRKASHPHSYCFGSWLFFFQTWQIQLSFRKTICIIRLSLQLMTMFTKTAYRKQKSSQGCGCLISVFLALEMFLNENYQKIKENKSLAYLLVPFCPPGPSPTWRI